jgi:hypothetical protein
MLSGALTIIAYGDDDQALQSVKIYIDGMKVADQAMPATYPYPDVTAPFNTASYSNGIHEIKAVATDFAGLNASQTISVYVQNPVGFDPTFVLTTIVVFAVGFIIGVLVNMVRNSRSKKGGKSMKVRESPTTQIRESPTLPLKGESRPIKGESKNEFTVKGESLPIKGESKDEFVIKGNNSREYKEYKGGAQPAMDYTVKGKGTPGGGDIKPLKPGSKYLDEMNKK